MADLICLSDVADKVLLAGRLHHFFPSTCFSRALSSSASARSFSTWLFSVYSSLSRLASKTLMSPNLEYPAIVALLSESVLTHYVTDTNARFMRL